MKILITGTGGFLGKELVLQLSNEGHELLCTTRKITNVMPSGPDITWLETNLSDGLDTGILPQKLDAIIHLAQSNGYKNLSEEAGDVFDVNIRLVQQLCEYGVAAEISSMVLASTGTVYEPFNGKLTEDEALRPSGFYGASKLAAELISETYSKLFSVCNLRLFFLYGPGQEGMLIARLIENVKTGKKVTLPKDAQGLVFTPTHVKDVARVFSQAVTQNWQGAYNVASPHVLSLGKLLNIIADKCGMELNLEITDAEAPNPMIPDLQKLRTRIDVDAFATPEEGIAEVFRGFG